MTDFSAQAEFFPLPTMHPWQLDSCGTQLISEGERYEQAASAAWPTANKAFYVPFRLAVITTFYKMFTANGASAADNVDVGIYDLVGNRIVSSGSTGQSGTTTIQEFDITDTTLVPGKYYLALACDTVNSTFTAQATAATLPHFGIFEETSAFPLPASATFTRSAAAYVPLFGAVTRTVI